jgi:hypothetical protein
MIKELRDELSSNKSEKAAKLSQNSINEQQELPTRAKLVPN